MSSSKIPRKQVVGELPLGEVVKYPPSGRSPDMRTLFGSRVTLVALDPAKHSVQFFLSTQEDKTGDLWAYMPYGPFQSQMELQERYAGLTAGTDPKFYAIQPRRTGRIEGVASYLRITPGQASIEIGHICFAPSLQRTPAATEALFLMMRHAFDDLGCRRLEWKCNALNGASRRAAERLGFTFEGIFRQHMVIKGRNRDSAWYSIIDAEWSPLRGRFNRWLASDNFDTQGRQIKRLEDC